MQRVKVQARKWGNSVGVILPRKVVETEDIKEGVEFDIIVDSGKKTKVKDIFGILKGRTKKSGRSTQEILDEVDKELWPAED